MGLPLVCFATAGMPMAFWKSKKTRMVVIGLDGVPYPFVQKMVDLGVFSNFRDLLRQGSIAEMASTIPSISSVAWASYMTGKNPGKHNIYGFVDRDPSSLEIYLPTSRNMGCQTLWEVLGREGKRVLVMNVPVTYPPRPVNGILIGCFLCTNIEKVAYPNEVSNFLKENGYRIDVDASKAKTEKKWFLRDLHEALKKRVEIGLKLYEREKWDFFQLHIMETDRINHFFWDAWENERAPDREVFLQFYGEVDRAVGEIMKRIDSDCELIILSDHGFCSVKRELNLNLWLKEEGYLRFEAGQARELKDIHRDSVAYSLIPGRIYVREKQLEKEIIENLLQIRDPESREPMVQRIYRRDEIYHGPYQQNGPDLVAVPSRGFELKGELSAAQMMGQGGLKGMHTGNDAFFYLRGHLLRGGRTTIMDIYPTLLELMKLPPDREVDGASLIS